MPDLDLEFGEVAIVEPSNKFKRISTILSMVAYLAFIFISGVTINTFVVERVCVVGESMYPSLYDGDNLLMYKLSGYDRGDIVCAHVDGKEIIKRVIALPGEEIKVKDGVILVDGNVLEEEYLSDANKKFTGGFAEGGIILGQDEYFLMGDNRNNSKDSRDYGTFRRRDIDGKIIMSLW